MDLVLLFAILLALLVAAVLLFFAAEVAVGTPAARPLRFLGTAAAVALVALLVSAADLPR